MLFMPKEKAKEACQKIHEKSRAYARARALERKEEYLEAKRTGKLDEYYANLERKLKHVY